MSNAAPKMTRQQTAVIKQMQAWANVSIEVDEVNVFGIVAVFVKPVELNLRHTMACVSIGPLGSISGSIHPLHGERIELNRRNLSLAASHAGGYSD